jgi:hypothetical protein
MNRRSPSAPAAACSDGSWRLGFSAPVRETIGVWAASLILFFALVVLEARAVERREASRLLENRWSSALAELRRPIERDLRLGFELADSSRAQALLDSMVSEDERLRGLAMFDVDGMILFHTDRSLIGERVPEAWQKGSSPDAWRARSSSGVTIGLPLRTSAGVVAGQLALSFMAAATPGPSWPHIAISAFVTGLVAWLSLIGARRLSGIAAPEDTKAHDQRLSQAEERLAVVERTMGLVSTGKTRDEARA